MGDYVDQFGTATVAQGSGGKRKRVHVDDEDNGYVKDLMFTTDSTIGRRQLTKNQVYGQSAFLTISGSNVLDLGDFDLNLVHVNPTGTIHFITSNIAPAYRNGKVITLLFQGAATVNHAVSGGDGVYLHASANQAFIANSTLTLVYYSSDGTTVNGAWREIGRSVLV